MDEAEQIRKYTPTLNPYVVGAFEIKRGLERMLERLAWDVKPRAWSSRRKMAAYKNRHAGEKCVILCNGPSLLKTDFALLKGVPTFGLNKINLLFDKTDFRPSYIAVCNKYVIEQNAAYFNTTDIPVFAGSRGEGYLKNRPGTIFFPWTDSNYKMARDCGMNICEGGTVTYVALQLAFHMGFEKVALIGCDHSFNATGKPNTAVPSGQHDSDHFDPNYFSKGVIWQLPDLESSERSYQLAAKTYAAFGRHIYNCTVGGKLELFPRLPIEEFLRLP